VKNTIFNKFFSSGIQAIAVQVLGIFFFYFISLYLSKENFGLISWANASCVFLTTILSCGMEQVIVRRIAVSKTSDWSAAAYLFHSFIGSVILFLAIIALHSFYKNSVSLSFLPLFFLAQSIIYIASPLKQFLNAKEKFTPYGIIALLSNSAKLLTVFFIVKKNALSIGNIALVLIIFAVFELLCLLIYILSKPSFNFKLRFKFNAYLKLLKEASPQYIAVIFDSGLSRMDWVLLGIISTNVVTADYSFAYRAFEISRLPIAIIAPVILPYFSRILIQNKKFDSEKKTFISKLFTIEMFFAVCLILGLNILWTPVISYITHGKYGASNAIQFLILSLCIPFQFFINLLWTLCFAGKRYRSVSIITITSACCNLMLNLVLIPFWGGNGAAIAFLITSIIQASGYYSVVAREFVTLPIKRATLFFLIAIIIYFLSCLLTNIIILRFFIAIVLYIVTNIFLRQIDKSYLVSFRLLLRK
jgi:O-antigen/teichoic acid export membrane protein